jgi:hypothetical protein
MNLMKSSKTILCFCLLGILGNVIAQPSVPVTLPDSGVTIREQRNKQIREIIAEHQKMVRQKFSTHLVAENRDPIGSKPGTQVRVPLPDSLMHCLMSVHGWEKAQKPVKTDATHAAKMPPLPDSLSHCVISVKAWVKGHPWSRLPLPSPAHLEVKAGAAVKTDAN